MAAVQTNEQLEIDSDNAQNAADILALIADYEDEVDTVVDDQEEKATASLGRGPTVRSRPVSSVQQEPSSSSLEAQIAGAQATADHKQRDATQGKQSQQASMGQQLDEQVEALQQQLSRTKQLRSDATTASPIKATPVASDQRTVLAEQLASAVSRIESLENAAASFQAQPSGQSNFEKLQAELSDTATILTKTLAAQADLSRDVAAIKTHIASTNGLLGSSPFVGQQQNDEELAVEKARLAELEYTRTSVNSQQSNIVADLQRQLDKGIRNNKVLNAQGQELIELLECSNANSSVLEADLAQANNTITKLLAKSQLQENRITGHAKHIAELRAELVEQTARLTKSHQTLRQELSQRREAEQMLRGISSRFRRNLTQTIL